MHAELRKAGAEFVEVGRIRGRLYDLGEYPGAVPSTNEGEEILGEIYRLDDPGEQLGSLDAVEEYDPENPDRSLFARRLAEVRRTSGGKVRAWVYFLQSVPDGARPILGGDYSGLRSSEAG